MLDALSHGQELADETVVYTLRQTAGRGQMGNGWESSPDQNIAFSLLLKPEFLPIREQFAISEVCCLGALLALEELVREQHLSPEELGLCIKWPNDLYAGDLKLGGILIENRLMGMKLAQSVLGVGINVNQAAWVGNAPNPVSLFLLGIETTPEEVLARVTRSIIGLYHNLRDKEKSADIHQCFISRMYRREGYYPYYDPQRGEHFTARVVDVDVKGPLVLQLPNGEVRSYWFKEVQFVLPCGVTKE